MYAQGANSVSCAQCNFVTNVSTANNARENNGQASTTSEHNGDSNSNNATVSNVTTVVVQNPDTLDENGNLVQNIAVGISSEQ